MINTIIIDDCLPALKTLKNESIDFIITSPPYAKQRQEVYGGIEPNKYIEWFIPISLELKRVLKKDGSFILNIKENVVAGERSTYVIELILALKKQGWLWTEEYVWHKKTSVPGKCPNRFRDAWERCLHFTKEKKFKMFQDNVKIPIGDWSKSRLKNLSENDKTRYNSNTKSGFGKKIENWVDKDLVYPTNVLHMPTECGNKNHSAVFPVTLPEWFIKLFTEDGEIVLDPFMGSGTTALASSNLKRNFLGIEINKDFEIIIKERLKNILCDPPLQFINKNEENKNQLDYKPDPL